MMNIETRLGRSGNIHPRRILRAEFTQETINYIATHPQPLRRWDLRELFMKVLDKPAIAVAALVVTLAISGTAYAAVSNWANISAILSGQTILPNGNRIVQVNTKNCRTDNAFTITKAPDDRDGPRAFEVNKDSTLTNEQITQMVLGNCEQSAQSDVSLAIQTEIDKNPANKNTLVGGYIDNVITSISPNHITLEADIPIGEKLEPVKKTFSHIDPAVQVYYKTDKLAFGDLRIGDHVGFAYRATGDALAHSETTSPSALNTEEATVMIIIKNTPNVTAAVEYQKHFGTEFREVAPCNKTPSGFCTIDQL